MRRIWLGVTLAAALALTACATQHPGEPASAHDDERAEDAFSLQIDTGRLAVQNERIGQALDLMPDAPANPTPNADRAHEYKLSADNIRQAWFGFLQLRARACGEGKFTDIACEPLDPPAWLADSAQVKVDPDLLVRRLDELQTAMGPLFDAACEQGKAQSKDENPEMFCSIE